MGVRDLHNRPAPRRAAWVRRGPTRARLLAGAAVASLVGLLVTAVWAADRDHAKRSTDRDLVRVGVVQGQSVPAYLSSSRGELDTLLRAPAPADTYALVTLYDYVTPDRMAAVLADRGTGVGTGVAEVYARVPIPSVQTQVVRIPAYRLPYDALAGMVALAQRRDREEADYRRLSASLPPGGAAEERLRRAYQGAAEVAAAEAAAYRSGCSCLFAAVVRTTPAVLDLVGRHRDVRVVDPAPEVRRLDRTEFRPPLPEELGVVPEAPPPASVPGPSGTPPPSGAMQSVPPALASMAAIVTSAAEGDRRGNPLPPAGAGGPGAAVPSALLPGLDRGVPSATARASRGASGR